MVFVGIRRDRGAGRRSHRMLNRRRVHLDFQYTTAQVVIFIKGLYEVMSMAPAVGSSLINPARDIQFSTGNLFLRNFQCSFGKSSF
jgi:hypothetical protein